MENRLQTELSLLKSIKANESSEVKFYVVKRIDDFNLEYKGQKMTNEKFKTDFNCTEKDIIFKVYE